MGPYHQYHIGENTIIILYISKEEKTIEIIIDSVT